VALVDEGMQKRLAKITEKMPPLIRRVSPGRGTWPHPEEIRHLRVDGEVGSTTASININGRNGLTSRAIFSFFLFFLRADYLLTLASGVA
jgi:hypothetical protein